MLGARIAALRRRAGLSQAELAELLQCSPSAVGMYEQGRRDPALDMLVRMARIFQVSTDYLLTGKAREPGDQRAFSEVLLENLSGLEEPGGLPGERRFSRQELAVLMAALLMDP